VPATVPHEIEVKYRVRDRSVLLAALAVRRVYLGPPVEQDDQAYAPQGWRYGDSKLGVPFVRLRTQAGRHIFTLKRPVGNELSCVEHETEVADRQAMHRAVLAMGFRPTVRIHKIRRTARHGDLSLCLDEVSNLGCFFEVEALIGTGPARPNVQDHLHQFVSLLGVELERTTATYDSLLVGRLA
jgi:adenylate cyclase, class 2